MQLNVITRHFTGCFKKSLWLWVFRLQGGVCVGGGRAHSAGGVKRGGGWGGGCCHTPTPHGQHHAHPPVTHYLTFNLCHPHPQPGHLAQDGNEYIRVITEAERKRCHSTAASQSYITKVNTICVSVLHYSEVFRSILGCLSGCCTMEVPGYCLLNTWYAMVQFHRGNHV